MKLVYMNTEIMDIYMNTEIMDMRKIVGHAASVGDEETDHFQRKKSVRFKSQKFIYKMAKKGSNFTRINITTLFT